MEGRNGENQRQSKLARLLLSDSARISQVSKNGFDPQLTHTGINLRIHASKSYIAQNAGSAVTRRVSALPVSFSLFTALQALRHQAAHHIKESEVQSCSIPGS